MRIDTLGIDHDTLQINFMTDRRNLLPITLPFKYRGMHLRILFNSASEEAIDQKKSRIYSGVIGILRGFKE